MSLDTRKFRHEYDLDALESVRPIGQPFEMLVTPRYRPFYGEREYEAFTTALIGAMSRSHALFVDVGAHYGFFSLLAASRNPEIEIVACEPVPETYEVLTRNFEQNRSANARAFRNAVSDRPGVERFIISLSSDNCGFYPHPAAPPLREIEIETVTVDHLLADREPRPALFKIDTDGHEIEVLQGMEETLERFSEVKLFVELNPKMQRLAGREPDELLADLDRRGFDAFLLDETLRRPYRVRRPGDWRELMTKPESYVNLYCQRRERSLSVAFFSHSSRLAGAERSLLELVSELVSDHGAVCTVVLPEPGPLEGRLAAAGAATLIDSYSWWGAPIDSEHPPAWERDFRSWLGPSASKLLDEAVKTLERIDPDVLVTHTLAIPWGAFAAAVLGKPHGWHVCEYASSERGLRFPIPFEEMTKLMRDSSGVVFTATEGIGEQLFHDRPEVRWKTLYRYIDVPPPSSDAQVQDLYHRAGAIRLGQFATQAPIKGQDLVLRATARIVERGCDVELVLAGDGREGFREELSELIQSLGLDGIAHLHRFIENVYDAMRETDVVIVGARVEAFCRVAAEGMLLGKPVVYPDLGGLAEYMRDGITGLAYEPGDPESLAEALERLVRDPRLRDELGRNGREHALSLFTREAYGGTAYRELLALRGTEARISPRWTGLLAALVREARGEARLWRDRHDKLRENRTSLEARLAASTHEARQLRHRIARMKAQLSSASRVRNEKPGSTIRKMAVRLRRPLDRLAPPGSRRRRLLRTLFAFGAKRDRTTDEEDRPS